MPLHGGPVPGRQSASLARRALAFSQFVQESSHLAAPNLQAAPWGPLSRDRPAEQDSACLGAYSTVFQIDATVPSDVLVSSCAWGAKSRGPLLKAALLQAGSEFQQEGLTHFQNSVQ